MVESGTSFEDDWMEVDERLAKMGMQDTGVAGWRGGRELGGEGGRLVHLLLLLLLLSSL